MKDVIIKIYKDSSVYTENGTLGINYENIQGKLVFEFVDEFVDGTAYLEFERKFEKGLIPMNKVGKTYEIEIKSSLLKEIGNIELQLRITQDEVPNGIPVYKSKVFTLEVLDAINATSEIPDEYPEWIDLANEKIKEMDNLNITTERVEDGVDIVLTDKKGNTTRTEVKDGAPGPVGPQGEPGAVKMQVVDTLPETGRTDTIYLVKKDNPGEQNLYDEYVYTETGWEHIGDTSVDLSDYYTKEESNEKIFDSLPVLYTSVAIGTNTTKESDIKSASEVVNALYKNGKKMFVYHNSSYEIPDVVLSFPKKILKEKSRYDSYGCYNETAYAYITVIRGICVYINGTWDNEVFTCTSVQSIRSNDTIKAVNVASTITDTTTDPVQGKIVKKYVDDNVKTYTAGDNIEISDDNVISATFQKEVIELTDEVITLSQLNPGVYILKPTVKKIKYSSYDANTYLTDGKTHVMLVGTAGTTYNTAYIFSDLSILRLNCYDNGHQKIECSISDMANILSKKNTTSYTPTGDYNPATKKYADDLPTTYTGYDATKTQVLKNINGTLTWVNE